MEFYAKASNYRVQIRPGGLRPDPETPGVYTQVPGDYAQFQGGRYATNDEKVIEKLRQHPSYGYGRAFWSVIDRPPQVALEEEMAILRAKVAAYEKAGAPAVVVVERPAQTEGETGLARLNRLKAEAREKGIQPERHWKAEDYEHALSALKEG